MIGYNERAWAIDLISEINKWASNRNVIIKRAGGESTVKSKGSSLFPDVLLFGDTDKDKILQGWELKFPDTDIKDPELIDNAKKKAKILGLNSFLIWNVRYAKLLKLGENGKIECIKTWNNLSTITKRDEVKSNIQKIYNVLFEILDDLLEYFNNRRISPVRIIDSITGEGISKIILDNHSHVANELMKMASMDVNIRDSILRWWSLAHNEYQKKIDEQDAMWNQRAIAILVSWVNKILFSHTLINYYEDFQEVESDDFNTSPMFALKIFGKLTKKHDFWNVFESEEEDKSVNGIAWQALVNLNLFLSDTRINELPSSTITELLSLIIEREKRKSAGQFATPPELASFMVNMGIEDMKCNFLDPCCGTGTIAKAALNLKFSYGIDQGYLLSTVWASDKFSFPVQMTTLSMLKPERMGQLIRVFKEDVMSLKVGKEINLNDPLTGEIRKEKLPNIRYIVSNLPFVESEQIKKFNSSVYDVTKHLGIYPKAYGELSGKSDLYAYIVLHLWNLIEDDGIITINISNSWLAVNWGKVFRKYLWSLYKIEYIVTSGNGRWFQEPKVVTNVLVMKKRGKPVSNNDQIKDEKISFVVLLKKITEYKQDTTVSILPSLLKKEEDGKNDNFSKTTYSISDINRLSNLGLGWNALFSKCKWLVDISNKLVEANKFFKINRGSRRGWDDMFYPTGNHYIEEKFLVPALKTPSSIKSYLAKPDSVAFCCNMSIAELNAENLTGAINWIKGFESKNNTKEVPLPQVLKRSSNKYWYSMSPNEIADIVTSLNPADRLFFARIPERPLVNQRFITFVRIDNNVDIELLHALLNSVISLFYLEAIGFGRGLGALDINAENLRDRLFILDPNLINNADKDKIKEAFKVISGREIKTITEELKSKDRQTFEDIVFSAFNLSPYKEKVITSLLDLYNLRTSVNK